MNALDIACFSILGIFLALGVYRGLIRSVSSLVAIIAGLILAKRYYDVVSELLGFLHISDSRGIIGYILVFLLFYIGIKIAIHFIHLISKASGLKPVDRVLGGLFGLIKGIIIAVIIISLLQMVLPKESAVLKNSILLPYSNAIVSYTKAMVPERVYKRLKILK